MPYEHRFRTGRFRDINLGSDRVGVNFRPSGNRRVNAEGAAAPTPGVRVSRSGNRVGDDLVVVSLIRNARLIPQWGTTAGDIAEKIIAQHVVHDFDVGRRCGWIKTSIRIRKPDSDIAVANRVLNDPSVHSVGTRVAVRTGSVSSPTHHDDASG